MLLPWFREDAAYTAQVWQIAMDHLADPEPAPRVFAAAALGTVDPAKAAPHIQPLLQDPDPDVRKHIR